MLGKVTSSQKIGATDTEHKLDVSALPGGTYTVILSTEDNRSIHKLVKL